MLLDRLSACRMIASVEYAPSASRSACAIWSSCYWMLSCAGAVAESRSVISAIKVVFIVLVL